MEKYLRADSLPAWFPLHHYLEPKYNYTSGLKFEELVDWKQTSLWAFVGMTAFNPIFWNAVARNEYKNKTITKTVRSPLIGCYTLAVVIFSLSAFRDHLYLGALQHQPALAVLAHPGFKAAAVALFLAGQTFVLSSMWALGVTGTYLGDYFGILMTHRVTGFPFNVLNDPMYVGSALTHLGTALWFQSPAGILLSAWVHIVYSLALRFEGPFTDTIYSAASKKASKSVSVPTTPTRKSSRIAHKQEDSSATSYADAAAEPPAPNGLPNATPKQTRTQTLAASARRRRHAGGVSSSEEEGTASPRRMTRSRSKPRMTTDEE